MYNLPKMVFCEKQEGVAYNENNAFYISLFAWVKKFSFVLRFCSIGLFFGATVYLQAYEPAILSGKYQTDIIDYNFYYRSNEGGGGWMPKWADYCGGRDDATAILGMRRSIVPSAMVDWNGDLYTVSLYGFGDSGPNFILYKFHYSDGNITKIYYRYGPFWDAWGGNPRLENEPYFYALNWANDAGRIFDEGLFKEGFHNVLQPCIFQEIETPTVKQSDIVRVFNYIPTCRLAGSHCNSLVDNEGGIIMRFSKEGLTYQGKGIDDRNSDNNLGWGNVLGRWYNDSSMSFSNCMGNFQGFHMETSPYYMWLIHAVQDDPTRCGIHCIRYTSGFPPTRKGVASVVNIGDIDRNTNNVILPRFFKIGNYVYFATIKIGWWFNLHRIMPNQGDNDSIGTLEEVGVVVTDAYVETTSRAHSYAPYSWDFCILEEDGSPCTMESSASTGKILCTFFLGGGGNYIEMDSGHNWTSTYVNWTYNNEAGVLASCHFSGTFEFTGSVAYAQNAIYVTGHTRASGTYVGIENTTKTDEYRLYLNSHKMVPYTSPSGKHYMIFAYCYPGKKEHLYLGYAQYIIDANHELRVLTQTVFKEGGNGGWGDSFGAFTDCTRIISMDLKEGHLWITFMKDSGIDVTGQPVEVKQAAAHYNYFHILVEDLIQE